jgi:hypothetical protein
VWAVGSRYPDTGGSQPIVEHWNGSTWRVFASPVIADQQASLYAVAATGPSNVWAVGGDGGVDFAEHYDGSKWTAVWLGGSAYSYLTDVAAVPGTQRLWTIESDAQGGSCCFGGLALQYASGGWKQVAMAAWAEGAAGPKALAIPAQRECGRSATMRPSAPPSTSTAQHGRSTTCRGSALLPPPLVRAPTSGAPDRTPFSGPAVMRVRVGFRLSSGAEGVEGFHVK